MIKSIRIAMGLLLTVLFVSCDNNDSVGMAISPQSDQIVLSSDTFYVRSANFFPEAISAQPDTMLLGNFYSSIYGSTQSELLVQFAPPLNYIFPSAEYNPQPDSLILLMYYQNWFGSSRAPLEISIYEMNKSPLIYSTQYMSNLDISEFCDQSILMGQRMMTSVDQTLSDSILEDESYVPTFRYKLSEEQLNRFFNLPASAYSSLSAFNDEFKGMYITTSYGTSTMLHLMQIDMKLYYHYTYDKSGKDTTVLTSIVYPANSEVRQLNKYIHKDLQQTIKERDSVNYITATAGVYPNVWLPLGRMRERISNKIGDRILNFNKATLIVEATELDSSDLAMPVPYNVLLLRAADYENFIKYNEIPTSADSTAVIGIYSTTTNSYTFDLTYMMTKLVRGDMTDFDAEEEMILIPVDLTTSTSSTSTTVTGIRPRTRLAGVTVRSGQNTYSPMRLEVIYNGF